MVLEITSNPDAEKMFVKALDHHDRGELEEAEGAYLAAIEVDQDFLLAHNNLAMLLVELNRLDEAVQRLRLVAKIDPGYPDTHNNLGFVYRRLGDDFLAATHYERLLELEPNAEGALKIRQWLEKVRGQPAVEPEPPAAEAPPVEAPIAEMPPTEAMAAEVPPAEAPPAEVLPTEMPLIEAPPAEVSPIEVPATEAPPVEAPIAEMPPTEAVPAEAPWAEVPPAEVSPTEAPAPEVPPVEAPIAEMPPTEAMAAEVPLAEAPAAEVPPAEVSPTEVPTAEVPAAEMPPVQVPAPEAVPVEAPAAEELGAEPTPVESQEAAPLEAPEGGTGELELLLSEGGSLYDAEQFEEAIAYFRQAVVIDPENGVAHSGLGCSLAKTGIHPEAAAELRKAIQLEPADPTNYYVLGFVLRQMALVAEAADVYTHYLELSPDGPDVNKIRLWVEQVKGPGAAFFAQQAAESAQPAPVEETAPAAEPPAAETPGLAEGVSPEAVQAGPGAEAPVTEDSLYAALAEQSQAVPPAEAPAPPVAQSFEELYSFALQKFQEGRFEEAMSDCEQVLESDPGNAKANLLLGRLLVRTGDYLRAVAVLRRASEMRPNDPEVYFFLGQSFEKRGLQEEARESYQKCLDVAPSGPQAEFVRNWLERAEMEGKASLGARCEYCFRSFDTEELTTHDGRRICPECLANLGAAQEAAESADISASWEEAIEGVGEEAKGLPVAVKIVLGTLVALVVLAVLLLALVAGAVLLLHYEVIPRDLLVRYGLDGPVRQYEIDKALGSLGFYILPAKPPDQVSPPPDAQQAQYEAVAFTSSPPNVATPLVSYSYTPQLSGVGERKTVFKLKSAPEGMSVDGATGTVTWLPPANVDPGSPTQAVLVAEAAEEVSEGGRFSVEQSISIVAGLRYRVREAMESGAPARSAYRVACADLNSDGDDDIAVAWGRYREGGMGVLYQSREAEDFAHKEIITSTGRPAGLVTSDFTGDGLTDVVLLDWFNNAVVLLPQNEKGDLGRAVRLRAGSGPQSACVGDLNKDGISDLVTTCADEPSIRIFFGGKEGLSPGLELATTRRTLWNVPFCVAGGGIGVLTPGDREYDMIFFPLSEENGGEIRFGDLKTASFLDEKPAGVCFGHFAREEDAEHALAVAVLCGGKKASVRLLTLARTGEATEVSTSEVSPWPVGFSSGDFNSDGLDDLLVMYAHSIEVYLLHPQERSFVKALAVPLPDTPAACSVGEFSGDTSVDVAVVTTSGKLLCIVSE